MRIIKDIEKLKTLYKFHAAEWDTVNIFGIRNTDDMERGYWNDLIGLSFLDKIYLCIGTTDPSPMWTRKHRIGVDHLVAKFHKDLWSFGKHRGSDAFVQGARTVDTWQDKNRNFKLDKGDGIVTDKKWWGINFHTSYKHDLSVIGGSSAGCQVAKHWEDFEKLLAIAKGSGQTVFSYMLMELKSDNKFLYEAI